MNSETNTDLYVFDKQSEELLAVLSNLNNDQCSYQSAIVDEQLNKDFTLEFSIPHNHQDKDFILEGNLIGYYDLDHEFQLFQIYKTEEVHTVSSINLIVHCEHSVYELIDDIVEEKRVIEGPALEAVEKSLFNSRWIPGQVDELGLNTINFYYSNAMDNIKNTANAFGGELKYRVIVEGNKITSRLVDLLYRRGKDSGRRFIFNSDITQVKRTVDSTGIKSAVFGRGKGEEIEETGGYTRKITFKNVEWSKEKGDPLDKPLGQEFIADPISLSLYGRDNGTRHRYGIFEMDTTDPEELLARTYEYLLEVSNPLVTYELNVIDLEYLSGYDHKEIRLGDTVFVIDRELNIIIEARVIQLKRNLNNPENTEVVLGNFIPDITSYNQKLEKIEATLNDRKGIWDKAFTENVENLPDIVPPKPTLTAKPLFKSISLNWDYDPSNFIKEYEIFASQVAGFTADSSNLIYRGKAGGYLFTAETDQTWYFRVNSVNLYGTKSPLSDEQTASTIRIQDVDFAELSIGDAIIKDISADKLTSGTIDSNIINVINVNADNINTGKLRGEFIEADSIYTEHLKATTKYLINNPTTTAKLDGWNVVSLDGNLSLSNSTLKENTLTLRVSSNKDSVLMTDFVEIEPIQSYKLSLSIYSAGATSTKYIGVQFYDKNKNEIIPLHYNINPSENEERIKEGLTIDDGYFYELSGIIQSESYGFVDIEGYILQSNVEVAPNGKGINTGHQLVIPENTQYIRVKAEIKGIEGESEEALWIWSPSLQRIDSGKISFDSASGGTLSLGGFNNEHGILRILDKDGGEVGTISGDVGGFSQLKIDQLENTENVVFTTSQYHPNYSNTTDGLVFFIDGYAGSDNNTGKSDSPLKSIQEAINRTPKFLDHNVYLNIVPNSYQENVFIRGFKGRGFIKLRSYIPNIRYIRTHSNGSSINTANHAVDFQAYDFGLGKDRKNVALNKAIYTTTTATSTGSTKTPSEIITDGDTNYSAYVGFGTGSQRLMVDLGSNQDITGVRIWRYWYGGRTYHDTKLEVSEDNINWITLQDSSITGEYPETERGYDASRFRLTGYVYIENCDQVEIENGWIQSSYQQIFSPITLRNSVLSIHNCILFANNETNYVAYASNNSWMRIRYSELNVAKTAAIAAAYNARVELIDCTGGDVSYGVYCWTSTINGNGTAPVGNIANTNSIYNGQIWSTWTHIVGEYTSVPPIIEKQIKKTWTSTSSNSWRPNYGGQWKGEGEVIQGRWDEWGNNKGLYFFGDVFSEIRAANVKAINQIRVYVTRASSSGYSLDTPIRVRTHNYTSRPNGEPSIYSGDEAVAIMDRGQGMWINLPSSMLSRFKAGTAKGIGVWTSNTSNREYARMTNIAKIEITYTIEQQG